VLAVVRNKAVELLGVAADTVQETTSFADDLGLDSLSLVEYTLELEDAFDVELPEEEVTAVPTFGGLVDLVMRQRQL
jgi:acyl carrier protein